jgi:hypothetical protein
MTRKPKPGGGRRLRPRRFLSAVSCAAVGLLILSTQGGAMAEVSQPPDDARAMTGVELYMLYRNKSWKWDEGAGRMEDQGRTFKAWAGSGDEAVWATGRWIVTDTGLLCFRADWHTPAGTYPDKTCFSHRISGQTIYQKKEPSGDWYVFRHEVPAEGDEFGKLVREDLVSARLGALGAPARTRTVPEARPLAQQALDDLARSGEVR